MTSTPYRLKTSEVSTVRGRILTQQGGRCAICSLPVKRDCLDHDHDTGAVRGVACSGCNALLGKLENNHKRYGVQSLPAFANGVAAYLQRHSTNITGYIHPTMKTEDEKRERTNLRARKARAAKRATA